MNTEQMRDRLARDSGYQNYDYAHDAVRQEIDAVIGLLSDDEVIAAVDVLREHRIDGAVYEKMIGMLG